MLDNTNVGQSEKIIMQESLQGQCPGFFKNISWTKKQGQGNYRFKDIVTNVKCMSFIWMLTYYYFLVVIMLFFKWLPFQDPYRHYLQAHNLK